MTRRIRVDIYGINNFSGIPDWTLHEESAADWEPGKLGRLHPEPPARCGLTVHHEPCPNPPIGRWITIDGPILLCAECHQAFSEDGVGIDRGCWIPLQA